MLTNLVMTESQHNTR